VLTRTGNLRIFQAKDVPDILKQVLQGFDVAWELHKSYPKREYCVQYRETDFNFISRLMEEEGIFYFFRHTASGHKLVIADDPVSHQDIPGDPTLIYDEVTGGTSRRFAHHGVDEDPGTGLRQEHPAGLQLRQAHARHDGVSAHYGQRAGRQSHSQAEGGRKRSVRGLRLPGQLRHTVPGGGRQVYRHRFSQDRHGGNGALAVFDPRPKQRVLPDSRLSFYGYQAPQRRWDLCGSAR
jgi:hypothetical protein